MLSLHALCMKANFQERLWGPSFFQTSGFCSTSLSFGLNSVLLWHGAWLGLLSCPAAALASLCPLCAVWLKQGRFSRCEHSPDAVAHVRDHQHFERMQFPSSKHLMRLLYHMQLTSKKCYFFHAKCTSFLKYISFSLRSCNCSELFWHSINIINNGQFTVIIMGTKNW